MSSGEQWKLPEIKSANIAEIGTTPPELNEEDKKYWVDNPPNAIIFASASLRKAILWFLKLRDYDISVLKDVPFLQGHLPPELLDATDVIQFQRKLEELIPNGNGVLRVPILIGYVHGVPFYQVPTEGETHHGGASDQARNKVMHESILGRFKGRNVIIFGSDTAGSVFYEGDRNSHEQSKPRNLKRPLPGYPYGFDSVDVNNPEDIARFLEAYKDHVYSEDAVELLHAIASFVLRQELAKDPSEKIQEYQLSFDLNEFREVLKGVVCFLESGGGGVVQQLINWEIDLLEQINDSAVRKAIEDLAPEKRPWALLFHILGVEAVPVMQLLLAEHSVTSEES